jgi:hypothetical protein
MSIIRSNIARQLLAEGGAPRSPGNTTLQRVLPRMDGLRPGFYGPDMGEGGKESDFGAGTYDDVDVGGVDFGGESGGTRQQFQETAKTLGTPQTPRFTDTFRANELKKRTDRIFGDSGLSLSFVANLLKGPQREVYNKDMIAPDLDQYGISGKDLTTVRDIQNTLDDFEKTGRLSQLDFEKAFYGPGGKPPKGEGGDNEPIKKLKAPITEKIKEEPKGEFDDILQFYGARFAGGGRTDAESQYGADSAGSYSYADDGNRDDGGGPPTAMGGGSQQLQKPSFPTMAAEKPGIMDKISNFFTFNEEEDEPKTAADFQTDALEIGRAISDKASPYGGALTTVSGGQKTDVPGMTKADAIQAAFNAIPKADGGAIRQNYGLGSIVKKAVGAVKKVAKSPIGKAALFAGLGAYGLGAGPFGASGAFANAKGAGFLKSKFMKDLLLKKGKDEFTFGNLSPFSLIGIPTVASYLFSKKEEEEDETLPKVDNTDPEFQKYLAFYGGPRRFAQTGGDIDEAPMKDMPQQEMASKPSSFSELNMLSLDLFGRPYDQLNDSEQEILMEYFSKSKDMPERTMAAGGGMMNPNDEMLNLGGNEMDLRGGGFVPLGEYEKKDDVPARLSKNEFVFTADAVKAAGGGSVDRGADIMYKTMKNLENKIA